MDNFLSQTDILAKNINDNAVKLYNGFLNLSPNEIDLPERSKVYFVNQHMGRLFFSIQTSAELLYRSIRLTKREPKDLTIMDYGAGIGSLFLLAKMIGIKCVIYNDYDSKYADAGKSICKAFNVTLDYFIVADHKKTFQILKEQGISCDIIVGRNIVEHIYDLDDFYKSAILSQPKALIYFSTTANYHNPVNRIYHRKKHRLGETIYLPKRIEIIQKKYPNADSSAVSTLAKATRGLALDDFDHAIEDFFNNGKLPNPSIHYTNTADPTNGVWLEHLIKKQDYKNILSPLGYKVEILPAFWDTHYKKRAKRILGKTMNILTKMFGNKGGLWFTAFIYVIAMPKSDK